MKIELNLPEELIDAIARQVADNLRFQLAQKNNHGDVNNLMTITELADYLKCSPDYIYKLTGAKEIPHIKRGCKFLLFRKSQIDKWLDSLAVPAVNTPISMLKKVRQSA